MARDSKKRGRRGATARANSDLETHIASLGLAGVEAYKTWCRQHGFTAALTKSWPERRVEWLIRERQGDSERAATAAKETAGRRIRRALSRPAGANGEGDQRVDGAGESRADQPRLLSTQL